MMKSITFASLALFATLGTVAVDATTYTAARAVGSGSLDVSITTDDTLGVLSTSNIVDWTITIADANASFTLLGPLSGNNSQLRIDGSALMATASDLLFDYDAPAFQFVLFQAPALGSAKTFWCVETEGCSGINGPTETILTNANFNSAIRVARSGVQVIASAVVPEPASWALMIAGFGLVGTALRSRRPVAA